MPRPDGPPDGPIGPPTDVGDWLAGLDLARYARAFRDNHIGTDLLPDLDADDLERLGVASLGHRKRLLQAISALRPACAAARQDAERRQLTVMFVDMVGSTPLAARHDPEDMRLLLREFNAAVRREVDRFGGFVAKFMGDGVLVYFGWPRAHEDEAPRAARAALATIDAVAQLRAPDGTPLAAHIGIATGVVVVGDILDGADGHERAVVGETPNLAARLQALAGPGEVIIADATRRLLDPAFAVEALTPQRIKGMDAAVPAYRITLADEMRDRFSARVCAGLPPMIGRERELAQLLACWRQAAAGRGRFVVLTGEAGLGKSRIVHALFAALADEPHTRIRCNGSPFHGASVLWPVAQHIAAAAGITQRDSGDVRLTKLENLVTLAGNTPRDDARILAGLLGIADGHRAEAAVLPPQALREAALKTPVRQLLGVAGQRPTLVVLEDIHGFDPTTLEALAQLLDRIEGDPIMIVATSRPDVPAALAGRAGAVHLALERLNEAEAAAMVVGLSHGRQLADDVVRAIIDRSDGVPVYVEEVTKATLESDTGDARVPASLHDSLMARLDRLHSVKAIAQVAARIGREFDFDLLADVADLDAAALAAALTRLLDSELVRHHAGTRYAFKRALVRDAAYESLLRERRREVHARIGDVLPARAPADAQYEPEVLAHHFDLAGRAEQALSYWRLACRRATERSANMEAVSHAMRGLACLDSVPPSQTRDAQELDLVMAYGSALLALKGWAAPQVHELFTRASLLASALGRDSEAFTATWNLWLINSQGGTVSVAQQMAQRLTVIRRRVSEREVALQAHHAAWSSLCQAGDLAKVECHIRQGLGLYELESDRYSWSRYGGHDAGVCGHGHAAWVHWMCGRPDAALQAAEAAGRLAQRIEHPYSQLLARFHHCTVLQYRRDVPGLLHEGAVALAQAEASELRQHAGFIHVLHGWAQVVDGDANGLRDVRRGLDILADLGIRLRRTKYLATAADACLLAGQVREGLQRVEEGLNLAVSPAEIRWRPELLRIKAGLLRAAGDVDDDGDIVLLRQAIADAQPQGAVSLALRAGRDLARLLADRGQRDEAAILLSPLYAGFQEGHDTADLREAAALLRAVG